MSRHIVESLHRVIVVGLAFRNDVVQDLVKVVAHIRVGIFVYGQAA